MVAIVIAIIIVILAFIFGGWWVNTTVRVSGAPPAYTPADPAQRVVNVVYSPDPVSVPRGGTTSFTATVTSTFYDTGGVLRSDIPWSSGEALIAVLTPEPPAEIVSVNSTPMSGLVSRDLPLSATLLGLPSARVTVAQTDAAGLLTIEIRGREVNNDVTFALVTVNPGVDVASVDAYKVAVLKVRVVDESH